MIPDFESVLETVMRRDAPILEALEKYDRRELSV